MHPETQSEKLTLLKLVLEVTFVFSGARFLLQEVLRGSHAIFEKQQEMLSALPTKHTCEQLDCSNSCPMQNCLCNMNSENTLKIKYK